MGESAKAAWPFVPLHVRSHYSLLDGLAAPAALAQAAAAQGYAAMALTDADGVYGAWEFQQAAVSAQPPVQPILGARLPLATWTESTLSATASWQAFGQGADAPPNRSGRPARAEVILLVENEQGWRHLCQLISHLHEGRAETLATPGRGDFGHAGQAGPLSLADLAAAREGLVVLTGPETEGWLSSWWSPQTDWTALREPLAALAEAVGSDRLYLQVERMGGPGEERQQIAWRRLARELRLTPVATQDVRYLRPEQAQAHQLAAAIRRSAGGRAAGAEGASLPTDQYYLKSPAQMRQLFADWPEALAASAEIAQRCRYRLPGGQLRLPHFPRVPAGQTAAAYLASLCQEGFTARFGAQPDEVARARLAHELQVIEQLGYASYFLIVWDLIRWARSQGIPVGPGRGSAAGSLVAYVLGITQVNPLDYGLIFERFLNPDRVSAPDIDIDLAAERRDEVAQYLVQTYGPEHVAHIITFGTLAARAAVREVGRLRPQPAWQATADRVARLIPRVPGGPSLQQAVASVPELATLVEHNEMARQLVQEASLVEGAPRLRSVHAAGVVITPDPLIEVVPVEQEGQARVTQWDMNSLEKAGLLKVDLLALSHLTFSQRVWERTANPVSPHLFTDLLPQLPLDDPAVYRQLSSGENPGVFQFDSPLFSRLLRQVRPARFADLIDLLALGRPGAKGQLDQYLAVRAGRARPQYDWPGLASILGATGGVILYQEQVMQMAMAVAGFTAAQADLLRRAMAKKHPEEMQAQQSSFEQGAVAHGVPVAIAPRLFAKMAAFAGYGFNKSHAAAYALLAYGMAWLLAHYPGAYLSELAAQTGPDPELNRRLQQFRTRLVRPASTLALACVPQPAPDGQGSAKIDPAGIRALAELPAFAWWPQAVEAGAGSAGLVPLRLALRVPGGNVWLEAGPNWRWPDAHQGELRGWLRPWHVKVEPVSAGTPSEGTNNNGPRSPAGRGNGDRRQT